MDTVIDPRTAEEIEYDAREWAAEMADLLGKTAWEVIREDERDYEEERRSEMADARSYYGY